MLDFKKTLRSLYGAWLLVCFDRTGLSFFENTTTGLWRSFQAVLLCAPIYLMLLIMRDMHIDVGVPILIATIIYAISYIISWFAFPYAMFYGSRIINRQGFFCRYISAYNWATVLQLVVLLAIATITHNNLVAPAFAGFLTLNLIIAIFIYKGFIAYVSLEIDLGKTIMLVLLDFIISLLFEGWTLRLLQATPEISGG